MAPVAPPPASVGPVSIPPTPPSSLLAYGADLRPPIASTPVPPPIPASTPGSAPVHSAGGAGPSGQPAVVRHQSTTGPAPTGATAGLTEKAFAATAAGAAAEAAHTRTAAENRLRRLLDAVARQRPELRWAIGDLADGSTVLTTDLAAGWIPPGIEIPAGVHLLPPADRRGDLAALLGTCTLTATYQPGQYLPSANDAESVPMSLRARDTTVVDDLGWELSQATKWRDGMPRLAHTLAKAVSGRTGYLDSEIQLLRNHLDTVARAVLSQYPDTVNSPQVGDWQLLATIDALINDEKTLANYHFAWFQARALTPEGRR